jgi:hypothetical protein
MSGPYEPDSFLSRELRPEARLILCCARTQVGPEMVGVIHTLSKLPLDWEFLCASADKHRLTQLLFRNLSAISPESMPAGIRARLRHQFHSNAGSNLRLARTQIGLQQRFSAEAIPLVPFKGSILACCTYGKLALRQYYDIDLLIRSQDVEKSRHLLAREGYVCDEVFDGEARYKHVHDPVEVDLHWGFTPRYFHLAVDFDELYARARRESLLGQPVITFSADDFLEILCVQVVKDCWERRQQLEHLSKVCDIAEHLRANPQIEWTRVLQSAQRKGLQRILHCALALARGLLQAELPSEVLSEVESDQRALACAREMCRSLFAETDTLSPLANPYLSIRLRARQLRFYLGIRERYRDRIKHVVEILKVQRFSRI